MNPDTFTMIVWTELQAIRSEIRTEFRAVRGDIEELRNARKAFLFGLLQTIASQSHNIVIGAAFILGTLGFVSPDKLAWIKSLFR